MNIEDTLMDIHDKIDEIDVEPTPGDGLLAAAIVGGAIVGGAGVAIVALPFRVAVRAISRTAHDAYEAFDTVRTAVRTKKTPKTEEQQQQSPDRVKELEAEIEKLRAQLSTQAAPEDEGPVEVEVVEQPAES